MYISVIFSHILDKNRGTINPLQVAPDYQFACHYDMRLFLVLNK